MAQANPNQNPAPKNPTGGDRSPKGKQNQADTNKVPSGTSDNLANREAGQNESEGDRKEQPRRYDEADPNWRNPDVQMQEQAENAPVDKDTII